MSRLPSKRNLVNTRRARLDESMRGIESGYYDPSGAILPLVEPAPPAVIPRAVLPLIFDKVLNFFRPQRSDGRTDYVADQKAAAVSLPRGAAPEPIVVFPAWESRKLNMRDFLAICEIEPEGPTATPVTIDLPPYTIPQGSTGFWKRFRFVMDPVPVGFTLNNTRVTLLLDDGVVPDYTNLPMGPFMDFDQDTFVIAASGRRITLRIAFTGAVAIPDDTRLIGYLYGNLGQRDGRAENQEVGNPIRAPEDTRPARAPATPSVPATVAQPKAKGRAVSGGRGWSSGKAGSVKTPGRLGA